MGLVAGERNREKDLLFEGILAPFACPWSWSSDPLSLPVASVDLGHRSQTSYRLKVTQVISRRICTDMAGSPGCHLGTLQKPVPGHPLLWALVSPGLVGRQ